MRNNHKFLFACFFAFVSFASCSEDDNIAELVTGPTSFSGTPVEVNVDSYALEDANASTRTIATLADNTLQFAWQDGDAIGVFPDEGSQGKFNAVGSGDSFTTAHFDGGEWSLETGHTYYAFYPYSYDNASRASITLDYSGQAQQAGDGVTLSCQKDFIYSSATKTSADQTVSFTFHHLGCFLVLNLTMPNAGTFTELSLCAKDDIFPIKQKLDLTTGEPQISNTEMASVFPVSLTGAGATLSASDLTMTVGIFLPAQDLSDKAIYLTAKDSDGNSYTSQAAVSMPAMTSGNAYRRSATMLKQGSIGYLDVGKYDISYISVGNSFSSDALAYVPVLLEELLPFSDIHIGIMYYAGGTLEQQWSFCNANSADYVYYSYHTEAGTWSYATEQTYQNMMNDYDWNYISFQQASTNSIDYNTFQPYLDYLLSNTKTTWSTCIPVWTLTHSWANGYNDSDEQTMYAKIAAAAQTTLEQTSIEHINPYGTAIQNARATTLNNYGYYGSMCYDGLHLQAGLPRLVASYTSAQTILRLYNIPCTIETCQYTVSSANDEAIAAPDASLRGDIGDVSATDYNLAKACALNAINNPYDVTQN